MGRANTRNLWRAFSVAPLVAPLSFLILFVLFVWGSTQMGAKSNPLSVVAYPILSILVGIPLAYALALIFWMPAMLWLFRRGWYNLGAVLGAGFTMSVGFAFFFAAPCHQSCPLGDVGLAPVGLDGVYRHMSADSACRFCLLPNQHAKRTHGIPGRELTFRNGSRCVPYPVGSAD
jgi:hypothetical protein